MKNNTKIIDLSKYRPLTKDKKEILKSHGSASSSIDMNKVKDWWKYGQVKPLAKLTREQMKSTLNKKRREK